MTIDELIENLQQQVDSLTEGQMEDLKGFLIQEHADRNKAETKAAAENIVQGLEQIFAQLDQETVQLLKAKIQG